MPFLEDNTCPFCGARFSPGASACPACDLPLLGEDGARPPERERTPFDGATLFDESFSGEDFFPERRLEPPLATESPSREGDDAMRCVVVAMNRSEAEMLEDMLRTEGVPCLLRTIGSEVYSMTGHRCEVLVPQFALATARELLRIEAPVAPAVQTSPIGMTVILLIGLLIVAGAIALVLAFA